MNFRWEIERRLHRGTYFTSTKAASRAMGFEKDQVGKLLRKTRGTKNEGYARFPEAWFISAKHATKKRFWNFDTILQMKFPRAFEKEPPLRP
jgi:hypothetical protein